MKDITMQIQIATGVPAKSLIAPSTKGLTAAPKFITVIFTPSARPLLSAGDVASNIGPVESCEMTVKGKHR